MSAEIIECSSPPDRGEVTDLLGEYYKTMIDGIAKIGVVIDPIEGVKATEEFWQQIDLFLPPKGSLVLARNDGGALVGMGMLKKIRRDSCELKRLFVRPEMRGTGLGRKLVEVRIATARAMNAKHVFVDTLRSTKEMQGLYKSLGFEEIEPYPESASYIQMPQHVGDMMFFHLEL